MKQSISDLGHATERVSEQENFAVPISSADRSVRMYCRINGGDAVNNVYRHTRFEWLNKLIHLVNNRCD